MIPVTSSTTHQGAYRTLLTEVLQVGKDITVRGRPTKEILNNVLEIHNPLSRCILTPGRVWNPWLAMSEGLWLLAGRNDIAALQPYNQRIPMFSDDGITTHGAYGIRLMRNGLPRIVDLLKEDPDTRRAVIPIYEGADSGHDSKDIPCNTSVMFKLRDNTLHMVITNRSNDIHWGLFAVNLCQFSMLQETVAYLIGAQVGTQVHFSQSLHVYTDYLGARITDQMLADWEKVCPNPPASRMYHPEYSANPLPLPIIQMMCNAALDDTPMMMHPFFAFARLFLRVYKKGAGLKALRKQELAKLRKEYNDEYTDWFTAAEIFLAAGH
jgi:hypothetical protein